MMQHVHLPALIVAQFDGVDQLIEGGIRSTFNQLQLQQE